MKYKANSRRKALEYEKDLVRQWKENKTFEKSIENRPKDQSYVFYDGPPFITGVPHHGTLLSSIVKDAVPRYWTMRGRRVERVWGWDCHGLPAEVFTEKKLGIQDRRDIGTKISLEEYITTCRENMVQTGNLWEDTIDRIGRWVDFQGAYKTMDKDFMESVWWAFKKLYDENKIYEGERVLLYCTRDATPLSKAEVTMDAGSYQDVNDPSVYVKFKLQGEDRYVLAWTTTPWTLPANTAVAVHKDAEYSEVVLEDGSHLIVAKDLLTKALTDEKHKVVPFTTIASFKGAELVGKSYEPLFADRGEGAHKIWHADYVTMDNGTGIVHLAPAYGEEDYALSKEHGFPFVSVIDENGFYNEGEWQGQNVWEVNKPIAKALKDRGVVWKIEYIVHSYPHCYRCGTRLMYRAHPSWFMDVQGQKDTMLEQNENVTWFPSHLKEGRFHKNIEQAPDWNISRDRFWATAMPVWKSDDGDVKVVGSYAELKELSGVELEDYHRPWVDDIEFDFDGKHYKRIDKVLDCWFESGSMPFAQYHYPFENKEKFESSYPGDFIVEYIGQVRAWFYYVHAVGVGLYGTNSYKNVITTGNLMGNDGRKLSKSLGNYTDPNEVMDLYSADALRFALLNSNLLRAEDFTLKDKDIQDVQRKLAMIWNMYDFFTLYASVDEWDWQGDLSDPLSRGDTAPRSQLDTWVLSRLHQMECDIQERMDVYDIPGALEGVLPFLDDASNWYVRRSRRRFWKSGDDADKDAAYTTLHYVLVRLSIVLAPFVPFMAEELYQKLAGGESVHLLDWPKAGTIDELTLSAMTQTRQIIEQGLALRMQKNETEQQVKVRQPLRALGYGGARLSSELEQIIAEEVNVKQVVSGEEGVTLDKVITPTLRREGLVRELIRQVQSARKGAGLQVDDRILLDLATHDQEVLDAIQEYKDTLAMETLASGLVTITGDAYEVVVKIDNYGVTIRLARTES